MAEEKQHIHVFQNIMPLENIASNFPFFATTHILCFIYCEMGLYLETLAQARNKLACEREQDLASTWKIASFSVWEAGRNEALKKARSAGVVITQSETD